MDRDSMIIGAVLIAIGFIAGGTGAFHSTGVEYTDSYPVSNEWSDSGTHDNTLSNAEGSLVLDNENENAIFISDIIEKQEPLNVDNIIFNASSVRPEQGQVMTLEVRTLQSGAVVETVEVNITENGRFSVPTGELSEGFYQGYQFVVELESSTSTSPELQGLTISGSLDEGSDLMNTAIMWLFVFLGLMMLVRGVN